MFENCIDFGVKNYYLIVVGIISELILLTLFHNGG